jgi:hypothetical protein
LITDCLIDVPSSLSMPVLLQRASSIAPANSRVQRRQNRRQGTLNISPHQRTLSHQAIQRMPAYWHRVGESFLYSSVVEVVVYRPEAGLRSQVMTFGGLGLSNKACIRAGLQSPASWGAGRRMNWANGFGAPFVRCLLHTCQPHHMRVRTAAGVVQCDGE